MKYPPKLYARALAEVAIPELTVVREKEIVSRFLALLKKNGDLYLLPKIVAKAEKLLREKIGIRKVTIEIARQVKKPLEHLAKKFIQKSDILEEKINPDLIAGVKIIVNDEEQFDGSLKRKLQKLFT